RAAGPEQVVDQRRGGAPGLCRPGVAIGLAEPAALRVGLQVEQADDGLRRERFLSVHRQHQNRSFQPRSAAKTSAAGRPERFTAAARAGSPARRKGLVAFSSPRRDGIVNSPRARAASMSAARLASAALSGSAASAKRAFESVYSWPQ